MQLSDRAGQTYLSASLLSDLAVLLLLKAFGRSHHSRFSLPSRVPLPAVVPFAGNDAQNPQWLLLDVNFLDGYFASILDPIMLWKAGISGNPK